MEENYQNILQGIRGRYVADHGGFVRTLCRTVVQFCLESFYFSFIDDDKSQFILEIIDGRELPEYMTMNKGKICG